MPLLSVDELMDDPDFATDTLVVMRNTETVGNDGMGAVATSAEPFVGIVSPARARDLQRLPEGTANNGVITVITATLLSPGDLQGRQADQVVWKGDKYLVSVIDDFSEWGAGFVAALCILQSRNT